ncbi:MAG: hypothetical protein AB1716_12910 [Planctomycetota bacterium]
MRSVERFGPSTIVALVVTVLGGCPVIGDFFAPGLATSLGLDPTAQQPAQGVVIVAFQNMTQFPAVFYAFKATNSVDWTVGARNFSLEVAAGQVSNEVLECPVGVIVPGSFTYTLTSTNQTGTGETGTGQTGTTVTVTGTYDNTAATIAATAQGGTAAAEATVAYAGQPLISGNAFRCGDVIEIRLIQATAATGGEGQQQQFAISVRVIPGT